MLIVFEGIDGCGKSAVMERVSAHLAGRGVDPLMTSEFGPHMPWGPGLKADLIEAAGNPLDEYDVVRTARRFHAYEVLEPAHELGRVVLMDRYIASTCAYQGQTDALPVRRILDEHDQDEMLWPDLTIQLQCSYHIAKKRVTARGKGDAFEKRGADFFTQAAEIFDCLAHVQLSRDARRIALIDADQDLETVTAGAVAAVNKLMGISA
ncbi:dTMP kinase [Pseudohongiella spirulinae]|uniref:Thymidylate kinase n=1 Tax=Pseudohongiella spirulinae TaxID=1249552 RepID=A0A0S2KE70_9GAMM|nr:dTMP kinase [Pseudohongiella spirulinae]ALO46605.1 hypothetical protein PS2015_1963 [Pseudohongiella spirulinae]